MNEQTSIRQGLDAEAFNKAFAEYGRRFVRFAVTYVRDATVAEDVVMDSFVAAWEKRASITAETFPMYVLAAVRNKCLNRLRSEGVRLRAAGDIRLHEARVLRERIATLEACDPVELFSVEARELVDRTLEKLPSRTRDVFIRSRFVGDSYKDIAQDKGMTVKSVEFEVSKALKVMRVALKDYLPFFVFWFHL